MSSAADPRMRADRNTENMGRGEEVAGLIAEIVQRDVQARRERDRVVKRRRVPVLTFLLVLLVGFGTWNFLRITKPPVVPAAQVEQSARAQLYLIASSLDAYRTERGRLPSTLAEAGLDARGIEYTLEAGRYLLVARHGTSQVTFREGQDKTPFAAALGFGGGS